MFLLENACSLGGGNNLRQWRHSKFTHINLIHWNIFILERFILRCYTHLGWTIVSELLRLNTVCPQLPMVVHSNLIICTLTYEKVKSYYPSKNCSHPGTTPHAQAQLLVPSYLGANAPTWVIEDDTRFIWPKGATWGKFYYRIFVNIVSKFKT